MAAKHDGEWWPNGWPVPASADFDEEGDLTLEWIFGKQGAEDSWRVMFIVSARTLHLSRCAHTPSTWDYKSTDEGATAEEIRKQLYAWLADAAPGADDRKGGGERDE